jgi:hemoglobin/transferrin/lactoferrin receptor protein
MQIRVLFFLLIALPTQAQTLTGVVRDATTNAPLPGATVLELATKRGTQTSGQGSFIISGLSAGQQRIWVSSVGYKTSELVVEMAPRSDQSVTVLLQPTVIQLNQLTVSTASRTEAEDFARPEITTVLTARELQQRALRSTPEALFGATGVWSQKTNHGGGSPFVRGLTGQQTLILVDGIRLNNATFRSGPNQYLNTIDPQSIKQIEVVRSSGSVAHGSDAIGGVVNILTQTPTFADKPTVGGSFYGKMATHGMEYSSRIEGNFSSRTLAITGGLAYRKFGDLVAGRGLGRLTPTGYDQLSGDLKARFRLSDRTVLTTAYQDLKQDNVPLYHRVRLENYQYYQFDPQRRQLAYIRLDHHFGYRWLQSAQLTASRQQQREGRQSRRNNNPTAVEELDRTVSTGLTWLAQATPTANWEAQYGAEWYGDQVKSSRTDINTITNAIATRRGLYPNGATMSSLALFSMNTFTIKRLVLTAGGRYQAVVVTVPGEFTGPAGRGEATIRPSALVGNLGASFGLSKALRLVGSVQSAFRAPNVDDLGTLGVVDFRYELPNANLRPERSFNTELGLKARTNRFGATLLAYHNRLSDFITRVRSGRDSLQGYPVFLKQNTAEAFIRGLEAEAEYGVGPGSKIYAGATYTYGQNRTANEPFRRIPPLNGRVGMVHQSGKGWWLRGEWLWAGAQTRLAQGDKDDNRIRKGGTLGWHVLNLNGGYRWRNLTLSAEVQNLANAAYRTHGSGVDGVGRSAWLSVQFAW